MKLLISALLFIATSISGILYLSGQALRLARPVLSVLCYCAAAVMLVPFLAAVAVGIRMGLRKLQKRKQ